MLESTPKSITAGDSAEWVITLSDYPAPTWDLTYALVSSTSQILITSLQYEATTSHIIRLTTSTTSAYQAGDYSYQLYASDGTDRYIVESGQITVRPNYADASSGYDARSFAKRALDAIEAVIESRASQSQLEYSIAGRQLKYIPPADLLLLRDRFRTEYNAELAKIHGRNKFGAVKVRFK